MPNMKDATLTASKMHSYVNPPFRQTVHIGRFPRSQMDVAREAYRTRPTKLTSEEAYAGVASAQRRKHHEAGTATPSRRAAQARLAAMRAAKQAGAGAGADNANAVDRFVPIMPHAPRAGSPRTDDHAKSLKAPLRTVRAPAQSAPRADSSRTDDHAKSLSHTVRAPAQSALRAYTGPGAAPNFQRVPDANDTAVQATFERLIATRPQHPQAQKVARAAQDQTDKQFATPQLSFSSFSASFKSARSFLSRSSSGLSQADGEAKTSHQAQKPALGLWGRLSSWFSRK